MASRSSHSVLRHLRRLLHAPQDETLTDGQLLEQFFRHQQEAALEALLERHGPMVLGLCRRVLRNPADADDAMQATFLVLVSKAGSIAKRESVGSWLYGVAYRIALRAKARNARRRLHETPLAEVPEIPQKEPPAPDSGCELWPVLDEELERLPEKYRAPMILCYLQGHTNVEAARRLQWSPGTLKRRLARARELLRTRLARRGLLLAGGVMAAAAAPPAALATVPAALLTATVRTAALVAAGQATTAGVISTQVAALMQGALHAMALTKLKIATACLLAVGMLTLGVGTLTHQVLAQRQAEVVAQGDRPTALQRAENKIAPSAPADQPKPVVGEQMTITGQVLDADDKPVAQADVAVLGRPKSADRSAERLSWPELLGQTQTNAEGRFRLSVPRTSRARFHDVSVLAGFAGHGLGQRPFNPDAKQPEVFIQLAREQVLRGRLLDLQGQPAAGVKIHVLQVVARFALIPLFPTVWVEFLSPPQGLRAWPAVTITDDQGRFTLRGLGPNWTVKIQAVDDRFARQALVINPQGPERALLQEYARVGGGGPSSVDLKLSARGQPEEFNWVLTPGRVFEGIVTYADTRQPVPHARLIVFAGKNIFSFLDHTRSEGQSDANGRFRLVPHSGDHFVFVTYPPAGEPYLPQTKELLWPQGAEVKREVALTLRRGVRVQGKITETPSGQPVAGASVEFLPRRTDNPFYAEDVLIPEGSLKRPGVSGPDGTFQMTVLPGPGHLLINGPTLAYLRVETSERQLMDGRPGDLRYYPNALLPLNLKPDTDPPELAVTLRRGIAVPGQLVGPDGQQVTRAQIYCRSHIPEGYALDPARPIEVFDGRFEILGCDAEKPQPVFFLDSQHQLGALVELSGKQAGAEPVTIRLHRCGSVRVRFVDENGKPAKNFQPLPELILTPGAGRYTALARKEPVADAIWLTNLDRQRNEPNARPDAEGRFTFATLIPGATYRILGSAPGRGILDLQTFTVEPGQTLELPDITVKTAAPK